MFGNSNLQGPISMKFKFGVSIIHHFLFFPLSSCCFTVATRETVIINYLDYNADFVYLEWYAGISFTKLISDLIGLFMQELNALIINLHCYYLVVRGNRLMIYGLRVQCAMLECNMAECNSCLLSSSLI